MLRRVQAARKCSIGLNLDLESEPEPKLEPLPPLVPTSLMREGLTIIASAEERE